ncbi:MAG: adenine methyltransferase [Aestuariibacter sp.]|nr:adenine methyltransferase [Aestuariibacter sp.]
MNPHFSSEKTDWETPDELFGYWNQRFSFLTDVCATKENTKCNSWWSPKDNGLNRDWSWHGPCWMNPPYGREIGEWVQKAALEAAEGCLTVALLPARTDTKWFHDWVLPYAHIVWLKGRVRFKGAKHSAPFPSMIAIYTGGLTG